MVTLLRFGRDYLLPYWHWYLAGFLAILLTNWIATEIPLFVADGVDALKHDAVGQIAMDGAFVAAMGVLVIAVRSLSRILFFTPGRLVESRLKRDLFLQVLAQQPPFLRKWQPGDLVNRSSSDVGQLRLMAGFVLLQLVNAVAIVLLSGVQMLRLSPYLTLWMTVPLALGFLITWLSIRRLYELVRAMQTNLSRVADHVLSTWQGVATVQAFGAEEAFTARIRSLNADYQRVSLQRANLRTLVTPTLALASSINVFLVLFIGGPMAIRGELSVGELIAFTQLVALLAPPLRGLTFTLHIFKQAQASLDRLAEVMDPKPERPDLPHPKTVPTAPPRIELRDLSFAWPDAPDMPVLKNLTLDIPAGSTLGILGPVGAGKSALIQLVARLYNPPPGTLLVDGVDIRELDLAAWRRVVATVPQRAFLFSESLQDNILLGGPDDGRLKHILELVALDSDVEILPQGKDTVVGEAGLMLSGGQRQRTALARGLLRNPLVLLLDDVLSAVDHATERQLVDTLDQAARRPTTLIVAHRVSALQHADRIIVLDGGRILDSGTHDELVERPGPYRETWLRQAESEVA